MSDFTMNISLYQLMMFLSASDHGGGDACLLYLYLKHAANIQNNNKIIKSLTDMTEAMGMDWDQDKIGRALHLLKNLNLIEILGKQNIKIL